MSDYPILQIKFAPLS